MKHERLRWLGTKWRRLFHRGREEAALNVEMQFHFDELVAQGRAEGLSESEARFAAQREFGTTDVYREEIRDTWRPAAMADIWRSLRFAFRSLARNPGFTLVAVVTLALGVGANTSMFSLVDAVMLKPLPYFDSDKLDQICRRTAQDPNGAIAAADYLAAKSKADGYGEISAYAYADASLSEPGQPAEFARALRVSANLFSVLRVHPQLGRDFRPGEEVRGNHRVVVISNRIWVNRFGGSADVIGRVVRVDGEPHEIIGVLPVMFNDWRHLGWVDFFRPLGLTEKEATDRSTPSLTLIGRRASTRTPAEASGFIAGIGERFAKEFPAANAGTTWRLEPLNDIRLGSTGGAALTMLIGLSGFVLLIACSNLANFMLARTIARAREFAVRSALGASRMQLLRPLMVESLVLALLGGIGAVFVALWFTDWIQARSTSDNGEVVPITVDWLVLGWALAASMLTAVAFGLAPALFAMRLDLNATLKSGARGSSSGRGHQRLRQFLIVGQFTLAMILLAGGALFARGLYDLNTRRQGWESEQVVTGTILLPSIVYPGPAEIADFQQRTLERLRALPGAASACVSYSLPYFSWNDSRKYVVEGQKPPEPGHEPAALVNGVSPDYFLTVGTRVVSGRVFTEHDNATSPRVYVISQAMATGLFGKENPIGRRLTQWGSARPEVGEIVGVVGDVQSIFPDPTPVTFQLYQPMAQEARPFCEIAVRTAGVTPASLVDLIRTTMAELNPDLPVRDLKAADERISRANYQLGVLRDMLSSFAVLGLGLAALGIYGVIARTMAQRTSEFGIRIALGAQVRDITRLVLASGVKLALLGSGFGLLGAFGVFKLIAMAFPNMRLDQGLVIVGATLVLIVVALVACYLPARRAARINPVEALRAD